MIISVNHSVISRSDRCSARSLSFRHKLKSMFECSADTKRETGLEKVKLRLLHNGSSHQLSRRSGDVISLFVNVSIAVDPSGFSSQDAGRPLEVDVISIESGSRNVQIRWF